MIDGDGAIDPHVVELATDLLARVDELASEMTDLIFRDIDFYASNIVDRADVVNSCRANSAFVFRSIRGDGDIDVSVARATGTERAIAGVPLTAVMGAYRVGFRYLWEQALVAAQRIPALTPEKILAATSRILIAQDDFTQAMTEAYRHQVTTLVLAREEERSALVEALLTGKIADANNLWEAAHTLRLPTEGPYVVVVAQVPAIGKVALPEIGNKLDARDIRSAWRLEPELQIGIVSARLPDANRTLIEVLHGAASARVGLSPPFDDLSDTAEGLRYARLAIEATPQRDSLVAVFNDSPLALAAVSAPEAMSRIAESVLGPLHEMPAEERTILLDTLAAWIDAGGSANDTAAQIFCHPNTVRHRLRRIEERTGRSLSHPREVAELCLALEVQRRLPRRD